MAHPLWEGRLDAETDVVRRLDQHDVDIKRLWQLLWSLRERAGGLPFGRVVTSSGTPTSSASPESTDRTASDESDDESDSDQSQQNRESDSASDDRQSSQQSASGSASTSASVDEEESSSISSSAVSSAQSASAVASDSTASTDSASSASVPPSSSFSSSRESVSSYSSISAYESNSVSSSASAASSRDPTADTCCDYIWNGSRWEVFHAATQCACPPAPPPGEFIGQLARRCCDDSSPSASSGENTSASGGSAASSSAASSSSGDCVVDPYCACCWPARLMLSLQPAVACDRAATTCALAYGANGFSGSWSGFDAAGNLWVAQCNNQQLKLSAFDLTTGTRAAQSDWFAITCEPPFGQTVLAVDSCSTTATVTE